jgi:hypothetical protein
MKTPSMARKILDVYRTHSSACPAREVVMLLSQAKILDQDTDTLFQLLEELIKHERELREVRQRLEAELQVHRMNQHRTWAEGQLAGKGTPQRVSGTQ